MIKVKLNKLDFLEDDANIDKFNQIIQKFSTDSQFITFRHNKLTMAITVINYGITMIEAGVSRVMPWVFKGIGLVFRQ